MKIRFIFQIFLSIILFGLCNNAFSQGAEWQPMIREIVVKHKDSTERAHILIHKESIKTSNSLMYYWYNKNKINQNMGGYSGDLLQGEYLVFDNENNLITQGHFERGLKHDTWKHWGSNGVLKKTIDYHFGLIDGEVEIYDNEGNLIEIKNYKAGEEKIKEAGKMKIWKSDEEENSVQDSIAVTPENER